MQKWATSPSSGSILGPASTKGYFGLLQPDSTTVHVANLLGNKTLKNMNYDYTTYAILHHTHLLFI